MKERIEALMAEIEALNCKSEQEIEEARVRLLGKKGSVTALFEEFRTVAPELKREYGQKLNILKNTAASKIEALKEAAAESPAAGAINGWLAFFLWVGIGLGATISVIRLVCDMFVNEVGWLSAIMFYVPLISILIPVAVGTIVAFYKRKQNAVALATVYLVMVGVDGLVGLIISLIAQESMSEIAQSIRGIAWAIVWGSYLYASETIRARIPVEKRKWGWFPITMISLFSILYLTFVCLSIIGVTLPA